MAGTETGNQGTEWIEWIEPFGPNNEPVYMRVAPETAIAFMKKLHPELTDAQALEEFIVVHWADKVRLSNAKQTE